MNLLILGYTYFKRARGKFIHDMTISTVKAVGNEKQNPVHSVRNVPGFYVHALCECTTPPWGEMS